MARSKGTSEARQRVVATADRLFYAEGVRAVGIDRVIAEAGVAKATLYAHFPSKDDLIVAVLSHRGAASDAFFDAAMARHAKRSPDRLRAFFAALKDWFESEGFRGCAFLNTTAELAAPAHPGMAVVRGYKGRFHEMLTGLVNEAVGEPARKTSAAVALLVEGAIVTAQVTGESAAADVARDAAVALVESARRG